MARAAIKMVTDAVDAFVSRDIKAAVAVIKYDDVVDDLFNKLKHELISSSARRRRRASTPWTC